MSEQPIIVAGRECRFIDRGGYWRIGDLPWNQPKRINWLCGDGEWHTSLLDSPVPNQWPTEAAAREFARSLAARSQPAEVADEPVRPRIVCLCGSTRFKESFIEANKTETLSGRIVLSVGMFGHQEGLDMDGPIKKMLDELHLRKIDLADEVFVLNVGGYIGQSTRRELEYAKSHGKPIRFLEQSNA